MKQGLFFDAAALTPAPRARRTDPVESHVAASRARPSSKAHEHAILAVLRQWTVAPLNCYQIAARSGPHHHGVELTQVQVARRMAALIEVGLVLVDGTSERGRTFRIVDARERALRELERP